MAKKKAKRTWDEVKDEVLGKKESKAPEDEEQPEKKPRVKVKEHVRTPPKKEVQHVRKRDEQQEAPRRKKASGRKKVLAGRGPMYDYTDEY